jgi:hypothetical protein
VDAAVAGALSQLHRGARGRVIVMTSAVRKRIRNGALGLMTLALAFYFGFIALLVFRSHH